MVERRRRARAAPRRPARLLVAARRRVAPPARARQGRSGVTTAAAIIMPRPHAARPTPETPDAARPRGPASRARAPARAFASTRALSRAELIAAPVRWPRPSRLTRPLELPAAEDGRRRWRRSGCAPSAICSSTCRATAARRARWPRCARGEQATVAVRGARDRRAAGAPARHAPAGRGDGLRRDRDACARRSSTSRGWWSATRRGRGCCCTARPTAQGGFRVSHHALARIAPAVASVGCPRPVRATRAGGGRPLSRRRGHHLDPDPHARAGRQGRAADVTEPLPARVRVTEGLPDRASALAAMHFPRDAEDPEPGARQARVRGAAARPSWCSCAAAPGAGRARARARSDEPPSLTERWLRARAAVRAHRRPAPGDRRRSARTSRSRARCSGC